MKLLKRLLLTVLASALSLGIIAFAAGCKKEPKVENVDYTITVTCEDSSVLSAVKVRLTKNGTNAAEAKALTNGKATFNLAPDSYTVELDGVSEGYTYTKGSVSATKLNESIAISKIQEDVDPVEPEKVTYTVNVTCENEEVLEGVQVKLMKGTKEVQKKALANGKATFDVAEDTYTVELEGLPETCDYTAGSFDSNRTMTITVTYTAPEPEPEPEEVDYVITVVCEEDSTVLEHVLVKLTDGDNKIERAALDNTGMAILQVVPGTYRVELEGLPEGCEYEPATVTAETRVATIIVTYTAPQPPTDPNREAFYGIWVDENGRRLEVSASQVQFEDENLSGIEGVAFSEADGKPTLTFTAHYTDGNHEIKITCEGELTVLKDGQNYATLALYEFNLLVEIAGEWTSGNRKLVIDAEERTFTYYAYADDDAPTVYSIEGWTDAGEFSIRDSGDAVTSFRYDVNTDKITFGQNSYTRPSEFLLPKELTGTWDEKAFGMGTLVIDGDSVTWNTGMNGTKIGTVKSSTLIGIIGVSATIAFDGEDYSLTFLFGQNTFSLIYNAPDGSGSMNFNFERHNEDWTLPDSLTGSYTNADIGTFSFNGTDVTFEETSSGVTYTGTVTSYSETSGELVVELEGYPYPHTFIYDEESNTLDWIGDVFSK